MLSISNSRTALASTNHEPMPDRAASTTDGVAGIPWIWVAAGLIALFVVCEHNFKVSTHIAFTQSADEMIETAAGGNTIRRLCFMALAAAGTLAFFSGAGSRWGKPGILAGLVACCVGMCSVSLFWADEPGMTIRRLMVLYFFLTGALGLARLFDFRDICRIVLAVTATTMCLGILAEIGLGSFRPWSGEYRFSGSLHPNTQGTYLAAMALSAMCLAIVEPRRRWLYLGAIFVAMTMLYLTKSRTSFAGVSLMLVATFLAYLPGNWKVAIPLIGLWLGVSGMTALLLVDGEGEKKLSKLAMMGREEESDGLTGRTTIWPAVMYFVNQRPILGYGYESFWTPDRIEVISKECEWGVREAHNSYLEATLMCGVVGAALFVVTALTCVATAYWRHLQKIDPCVLFWFGYPLNGMFNGLCESGMMMICFPTFVLAVGIFRMSLFESASRVAADERDRDTPSTAWSRWIDALPSLWLGGKSQLALTATNGAIADLPTRTTPSPDEPRGAISIPRRQPASKK